MQTVASQIELNSSFGCEKSVVNARSNEHYIVVLNTSAMKHTHVQTFL